MIPQSTMKIQRILHPTDFSEPSIAALHFAAALAADHQSELIVLHVLLSPISWTKDMSTEFMAQESYRSVRERLNSLPLGRDDVTARRILVMGTPATRIVSYALEHVCDLIVMGTHGQSGFRSFLIGSVALEVLKKSPCPVLITKAPVPAAEEACHFGFDVNVSKEVVAETGQPTFEHRRILETE